jgi:hypothetical protein
MGGANEVERDDPVVRPPVAGRAGRLSSGREPGLMAPGRPTIEDVARIAGVSSATVSRVVNADVHVRDETRRRVQRAINPFGYERKGAAPN